MRLADILAHTKDTPTKNVKLRVHGLPISIEHPKGTLRKLHDDKGNPVYTQHMSAHYGFFNKTKGRDGDEVDCFVGPDIDATEVFIIHMIDKGPVKSEREDEDKCMLQYASADAAKAAFLAHYREDFYGGMTALPVAVFKKKLKMASLPNHKRKITAKASKCPHCGSKKYRLMPTDFETAKCDGCGKNWEINAGGPGSGRHADDFDYEHNLRKSPGWKRKTYKDLVIYTHPTKGTVFLDDYRWTHTPVDGPATTGRSSVTLNHHLAKL